MSEDLTAFHLQGNDLLEEKQKVREPLGVEGNTGASESRSAGEAKCDQHMETFVKCIKASGGSLEIQNTSAPSINPRGCPVAVVTDTSAIFQLLFVRARVHNTVKVTFEYKTCPSCRWQLGGRLHRHQNDGAGEASLSGWHSVLFIHGALLFFFKGNTNDTKEVWQARHTDTRCFV